MEPQVQLVRSQIDVVAGGVELGVVEETAAGYSFASLFRAPQVCSMHERHARRPGWTDLFFDLVFAAAIAQLVHHSIMITRFTASRGSRFCWR